MFALEDIEECLKTRLSYSLTSAFPENPLIYLDGSIYRNQQEFLKFSSLFYHEFKSNRKLPFIRHQIKEYGGNLPMWVAVEILTIGNISAIYQYLKTPYQKTLARSYQTGPVQLESWIKNMTYTRNHLAHYMRVYDFNFAHRPVQCKYHHLYKEISGKIFDQIYIMSFLYSAPEEWNNYVLPEIEALLEEYAEYVQLPALGFPENWRQILTISE